MENQSISLKLVSLNCEGVKNKLPFIQSLCDQVDILCLQETWLLPHETNLISNVHVDFDHFSLSAVDIQSSILVGRSYGGLTIMYKKELGVIGSVVNFEDNRRDFTQMDAINNSDKRRDIDK